MPMVPAAATVRGTGYTEDAGTQNTGEASGTDVAPACRGRHRGTSPTVVEGAFSGNRGQAGSPCAIEVPVQR